MTVEPRIEDLLATIRKAIDSDLGDLDRRNQPRAASATPPYNPQHYNNPARGAVDASKDIDALRERVNRQRFEPPPLVPSYRPQQPIQRSGTMGSILNAQPSQPAHAPPNLRPSFADEAFTQPKPQARPAQAYYEPQPQPEEQYYPEEQQQWQEQPLMTRPAAYAAQASFAALGQQITEQFADEGRLEEIAREMLRPMLQNWLDENLPPLVEALVREEISRVARRGR